AGKRADRHVDIVGFDADLVSALLREGPPLARVEEAEAAELFQDVRRQVEADVVAVEDRGPPLLADEGDAALERIARRAEAGAAALEADLARKKRIGADDGADD